MLKNKKEGIYIDIGANDPNHWNNTKYFYNKGWSGINIEPNPELFSKLSKFRPRDINLNIGMGPKKGALKFYKMSDDKISTFDAATIPEFERAGHKVIETLELPVLPLKDIFEKYYPDKKVDFISVDVEGFDLEVLKSNDWSKYRPVFVILEILRGKEDLIDYMSSINYSMAYNNWTNGIFLDQETNYSLPLYKFIHKFMGIV